jgi:DNA gyrase subunit A
MATNIPPHNLGELINGLTALLDRPDLSTTQIMKYVKGPDFPTGATLAASKKELREIYDSGRGSIKIRGDYRVEPFKRGKQQIIITSLPYTVNKSKLVEKIAQLIIEKKMQALSDVRDESAETIRIVLEPKPGADITKIMAYLYRYTELEYNFAVNLTALDPTGTPRRMSIVEILGIFVNFRIEVTERRLKYDLSRILERLHILRGLIKVLKELDAAIKLIRQSKSRDEAKSFLKKKFRLDDTQVSAVLDLRLSSLVAMEINKVRLEAAELEARREMLEDILKSKRKIKGVVKKELLDIKKSYADRRRTAIAGAAAEEEYVAEDFVEHEACYVIVSRNGWARRIKSEPSESQLRFKEGDSLLQVIPSDTSEHIAFFSSAGKMYVIRAHDLPQTTGFGDPVQTIFKFGDGERLIASDHFPNIKDGGSAEGELLAIMENGAGLRISRDMVGETTRSGRRYANVKGDNAVYDVIAADRPLVYIAHNGGKGLLFKLKEIPLLAGPGAGVRMIKLKKGDRIIGVKNVSKKDSLRLVFDKGRDVIIKVKDAEPGRRATAGRSYGGAKKNLMALVIE